MSEIAPAEPRPISVLDHARALLPEIRARAEEIEQARAVPRDLAAARSDRSAPPS
jgi:hypothetical protein